jgi:hypothetical protein
VASAQGRSFLTVQMQERSDERRYFLSDLLVDLASISHLRLDDENASRCWLETRTGKFAFAPLSSTSVNAGRVRRRTLVCSALPYYRREREREEEGRLGGRAVSVRLPAHDATYPPFFLVHARHPRAALNHVAGRENAMAFPHPATTSSRPFHCSMALIEPGSIGSDSDGDDRY